MPHPILPLLGRGNYLLCASHLGFPSCSSNISVSRNTPRLVNYHQRGRLMSARLGGTIPRSLFSRSMRSSLVSRRRLSSTTSLTSLIVLKLPTSLIPNMVKFLYG